jgi:hypothetical protein
LHEKIDRKKELLYKDELPASVLEELALQVMRLKARIRAQAAGELTLDSIRELVQSRPLKLTG